MNEMWFSLNLRGCLRDRGIIELSWKVSNILLKRMKLERKRIFQTEWTAKRDTESRTTCSWHHIFNLGSHRTFGRRVPWSEDDVQRQIWYTMAKQSQEKPEEGNEEVTDNFRPMRMGDMNPSKICGKWA